MTMIKDIEHSRQDLVREACVLFFVEAVVSTIFKGFPFAELLMAQVSLVGGYLTAKTVSNMNQAKYDKPKIVGE